MVMNTSTKADAATLPIDKIEELSWKMLDNNISDADLQRLEHLLQNDADCRQRYLDCVKLHGELNAFFNSAPQAPEASRRGPALGMRSHGSSASNPTSLQR
ncbi:hypothetical protein [Novipirellula sp.]|uniref:hypothetical protein n=1 Tax=Novipirellula sp. TaxID=2795430 RepID=UPI003564A7DD